MECDLTALLHSPVEIARGGAELRPPPPQVHFLLIGALTPARASSSLDHPKQLCRCISAAIKSTVNIPLPVAAACFFHNVYGSST